MDGAGSAAGSFVQGARGRPGVIRTLPEEPRSNAMARPTWNGTISFALLSIPVKLYTAQRPKDISFNQLERSTGQRIKQRRVSAVSGEEVPSEEIIKGYDLGGGRWVEVEQAELDALAP